MKKLSKILVFTIVVSILVLCTKATQGQSVSHRLLGFTGFLAAHQNLQLSQLDVSNLLKPSNPISLEAPSGLEAGVMKKTDNIFHPTGWNEADNVAKKQLNTTLAFP